MEKADTSPAKAQHVSRVLYASRLFSYDGSLPTMGPLSIRGSLLSRGPLRSFGSLRLNDGRSHVVRMAQNRDRIGLGWFDPVVLAIGFRVPVR